jgi:hypothetical protein
MEEKKQEAPKEKQQEHPPRDYYTRVKSPEKTQGDSSGANQAGLSWAGVSWSGGRER